MEKLSDIQRGPESQLKFITDTWQLVIGSQRLYFHIELCRTEFLNTEQIPRKQKYTDNGQDEGADEHKKKVVTILDDLGEV
ncbi:hypothetical protein GBA52_003789 [Prunus armeniaca]|nr:hypothetical protein GBA52_003789 [Prunus armeniaca]